MADPPYKLECPRVVQAVRLVHTAPKTHSITLGMVLGAVNESWMGHRLVDMESELSVMLVS
ncbi:hypothetical protein ABN224_19595 [Providencia rettgeri]